MVDKKARRRSDGPPVDLAADLKVKRAEFVQTFFKRGAEFTEELVSENERLRGRLAALETENTKLRTQLAKDRKEVTVFPNAQRDVPVKRRCLVGPQRI